MYALTLAALTALTGTALAVPEVTAQPAGSGCAVYPHYDAASGNTSTFLLNLVETGNAAVEGFGDTDNYVRGQSGIRFGYITFPSRNDIAKTQIQCRASTLSAYVEQGVSGFAWTSLNISPYGYDATLIYDVKGSPAKPFHHFYPNGTQMPGLFIGGYENSTTWGVKYYPKGTGAYGQDYYYIRLLGPDSADPKTGQALQEGEFTGFVKVAP